MTYRSPEQRLAKNAYWTALRHGDLVRPDTCEWCGAKPGRTVPSERYPNGKALIDGHHHNGYDEEHWLDVVWICQPCHQKAEPRRLGIPHTEEIKQQIAESGRRTWAQDDGTRAARQAERNRRVWTGRKHTPEARAKISAARRGA